jgi:hypothetical protein
MCLGNNGMSRYIIGLLPSKTLTKGSHTEEFVEERRKKLNAFLEELVKHRDLVSKAYIIEIVLEIL